MERGKDILRTSNALWSTIIHNCTYFGLPKTLFYTSATSQLLRNNIQGEYLLYNVLHCLEYTGKMWNPMSLGCQFNSTFLAEVINHVFDNVAAIVL